MHGGFKALAIVFGCLPGCNYIIGIGGDYVVGETGGGGGAAPLAAGSPDASSGTGGTAASVGSGGDVASTGTGASASAASGGSPAATVGSGGSTSSVGGGAVGTGGGPVVCPSGVGPAMIDVGGYCVDETEVTNDEYAAWLATSPDVGAQPSECSSNNSFVPQAGWPAPGGDGNAPVVYVDWCDAYAFCSQTGKRLCGKIGGGQLGYDEYDDVTASQWAYACTSGGTTDYPYGDAYSPNACDGADLTQPDHKVAVKQMGACRGASAPFSDVYDMSGNVHEWEDACAGSTGAADACRRRGGSFKENATGLRCDASASLSRGMNDSRTGFRCCAF
jgi:hypothetical protein